MSEEEVSWHPFLDWYDVRAGDARYAPDGRQVLQEAPSGVRLTVGSAGEDWAFILPENEPLALRREADFVEVTLPRLHMHAIIGFE